VNKVLVCGVGDSGGVCWFGIGWLDGDFERNNSGRRM
jgi:hypothetical protein